MLCTTQHKRPKRCLLPCSPPKLSPLYSSIYSISQLNAGNIKEASLPLFLWAGMHAHTHTHIECLFSLLVRYWTLKMTAAVCLTTSLLWTLQLELVHVIHFVTCGVYMSATKIIIYQVLWMQYVVFCNMKRQKMDNRGYNLLLHHLQPQHSKLACKNH